MNRINCANNLQYLHPTQNHEGCTLLLKFHTDIGKPSQGETPGGGGGLNVLQSGVPTYKFLFFSIVRRSRDVEDEGDKEDERDEEVPIGM